MGPWDNMMTYPETDLDLNNGCFSLNVCGDGFVWSWGPQLASVNAVGIDELMGKLR